MKKAKILISFLLILCTVSCLSTAAFANFGYVYTAPKGTPVLDGEIDDVWNSSEWTTVDNPWDGIRDTDSVLRIKLLWDEDYLYFLAVVHDTQYNKKGDIVEVYIDQYNNKSGAYEEDDFQNRFRVSGGCVVDEASEREHQQIDAPSVPMNLGDNKYLLEGACYWPMGAPAVGDEMGLEFMYSDGTKYFSFIDAFRWNADTANGDDEPWASTKDWGTLILADARDALDVDQDPFAGVEIPVVAGSIDAMPTVEVPAVEATAEPAPAEVVAEAPVTEEPAEEAPAAEETKTADPVIIAVIAAVVVIAIIAVVLITKKKKSGK